MLEQRTIKELKEYIIDLYKEKEVEELRNYITLSENGWHQVSWKAPVQNLDTYCPGTTNEHRIEIRIPGIRTFFKKKGSIENDICSYDFRIRLSNNKNIKRMKAIKHTDVVNYLYEIVASAKELQKRQEKYLELKNVLVDLYNDKVVFQNPLKKNLNLSRNT